MRIFYIYWSHNYHSLGKGHPNFPTINAYWTTWISAELLCIVNAKAIYRLHTANHITLMWCQEMIYENGSMLSLSRVRPGWTRSVDTKPIRLRKQALAELSFITSQCVLFPAPDEILSACFSSRSAGDFARFFRRAAKCFKWCAKWCFMIMPVSGDASQLFDEK